MSELYRALYMKPHPVPEKPKRGVSKVVNKPRTDAMTVFEPLMKGKGPLSLEEIAKLFKGKKSKCAVYNCLRNTLEPKDLVKVGYRPYKGAVELVTYEWSSK